MECVGVAGFKCKGGLGGKGEIAVRDHTSNPVPDKSKLVIVVLRDSASAPASPIRVCPKSKLVIAVLLDSAAVIAVLRDSASAPKSPT